jgi:hypothetical protein
MKRKTKKWWGGFSSGKLDMHNVDDGWGGHNERLAPAIFPNRKAARQQYQDVRRIEVSFTAGKDKP